MTRFALYRNGPRMLVQAPYQPIINPFTPFPSFKRSPVFLFTANCSPSDLSLTHINTLIRIIQESHFSSFPWRSQASFKKMTHFNIHEHIYRSLLLCMAAQPADKCPAIYSRSHLIICRFVCKHWISLQDASMKRFTFVLQHRCLQLPASPVVMPNGAAVVVSVVPLIRHRGQNNEGFVLY